MSNELPEFIKPFHFHGVDVSHSSGSEWTAECPICDKGEHWYVNDTNGMWECKSCGESGNVSTFLKHHHAQCLSDTTPAQYKELATLRHPIPTSIFKINRLAYDSDNRRWLVPIYNDTGGLSNLRVWFKVKDPKTGDYKYLFLNTPGCKAQLFGADQLGPKSKERYPDVPKGGHPHVILCEGEWDGMAMQNIVNKAKIEATVVAVPGANIYKDYWSKLFKGKTLWICYDNDEDRETSSGKIVNPGKDGMVRVLGRLKASKSKPKEVLVISWPSSAPLSYDLRDFARDHDKKSRLAFKTLTGLMKPPEDVTGSTAVTHAGPSIVRNTFEEVLEDFRRNAHIDSYFEDALAVCLATAISVRIPGDPVWLFLVAPPGGGKTLLLDSFATAKDYAECISKMTDKTLVSGWKAEGEDVSLIPTLNGRTLVIKDYTTIISMPAGTQEALYGILRDVYDGDFSTKFGNTKDKVEYHNIYFSMIAGVTDAIHRNDRAELGERFLKIELLSPNYDPRNQIVAAMSGSTLKQERSMELRDSVHAWLQNDFDTLNMPTIPGWFTEKLVNLAQLVAYIRTGVARTRDRDLVFRPRAEVGSRPASQLKRLAICLCYVLGKDKADNEVYRLCHRVAMDTVYGHQREAVAHLYQRKAGMSATFLSRRIRLGETQVKRIMEDMMEIGMIDFDFVENGSGNRGRSTKVWKLTPQLQDLWKRARPMSAKLQKEMEAKEALAPTHDTKTGRTSSKTPNQSNVDKPLITSTNGKAETNGSTTPGDTNTGVRRKRKAPRTSSIDRGNTVGDKPSRRRRKRTTG